MSLTAVLREETTLSFLGKATKNGKEKRRLPYNNSAALREEIKLCYLPSSEGNLTIT